MVLKSCSNCPVKDLSVEESSLQDEAEANKKCFGSRKLEKNSQEEGKEALFSLELRLVTGSRRNINQHEH